MPVRRLLAAAGPGSTYSDFTVLSTACGKGVSTDCSMMRWEMCSCGMTNWAVYSASSPVCVPTSARGRWGGGGFCRHGALCFSSCPSSSALVKFCHRGAEWWLLSARAMATLICVQRKYARRRRSLRLLAAPACSAIEAVHIKILIHERSLCKPGQHLRRELDDDDETLRKVLQGKASPKTEGYTN